MHRNTCLLTSIRFISIPRVRGDETKHRVSLFPPPFNRASTRLTCSGSKIHTGAFVTNWSCSQWVPGDKSMVQMHARPGFSRRFRAGITQSIYYPTQRLPWILFQCSPSRLDTVMLLFAEIHGGSKTKQAAPG